MSPERLREFRILPQPDEVTCGPTCLHAIYRYYGDEVPLASLVERTPMPAGGGTLAAILGVDALRRGYRAWIYTYNLNVFDPTWFPGADLAAKLWAQREVKDDPKIRLATENYLEFLQLGGVVKFEDLTGSLLRRYLKHGRPILTCLNATYLYRSPREISETNEYDDVRGEPSGHFVVLCGYDPQLREVLIADPYTGNPAGHSYHVGIERLVGAILLGVLAYDSTLLILEPR